jgi:ADP-ribose pyrophosphatase YjhB (NUDIX family)
MASAASPGTAMIYAIWRRKPAQGNGPAVLVGKNGKFVTDKDSAYPHKDHARVQQRVVLDGPIQDQASAMAELDNRIQTDAKLRGMQYSEHTSARKTDNTTGKDYFTFRLSLPRKELTFPKGGIEAGETAQQAARREFEEEVGIAKPESDFLFLGNVDGVAVFKVVLDDKEATLATRRPNAIRSDLFGTHWVDISAIPSLAEKFNPQSKSAILSSFPPVAGGVRRTGRSKLGTKKRHTRGRARKTRRVP